MTKTQECGLGVSEDQRDAGDLAREAFRYAQALSVLGVDPDADSQIDRLVEERVQGIRNKRPLRKRPV